MTRHKFLFWLLVLPTIFIGAAKAQLFGPNRVVNVTSLPATCSVGGPLYQKTTASVGLYECTATDTLTLVGPASFGDFSTNTATSVDGEVVLFSGTSGKLGKRATGTGVATLTSGVLGSTTTLGPTSGGTGLATFTLGDLLYSSASNTLAALAGNTTATKKFLTQTGNGSVSAAPGWNLIVSGDLPAGTATGTGTTNTIPMYTTGSSAVLGDSIILQHATLPNVGINTTASAATGIHLSVGETANNPNLMNVSNTSTGASARSEVRASGSTVVFSLMAYSSGNTATGLGVTKANYTELQHAGGGGGMLIDTSTALPILIGTNSTLAITVGSDQKTTFAAAIVPSSTIGITGTTTNDNANAGAHGEFTSAQCPGPSTTATITVTIASPGVVTWSSHPFSGTAPRFDACPVVFTTSGSLPTGITASTNYWVVPTTISGNNFSIATSVANAIAGTTINTSGSQSGTHTGTAGTVLATTATKDVTGLALTAGDWDCTGVTSWQFGSSTSYTNITSSISTTSATLGGQGTLFDYETPASVPTAGSDMAWPLPTVRQLLSGTTNVFAVAQGTFTLSSLKAYGTLRCRRMR